jgi:hypothetical protein
VASREQQLRIVAAATFDCASCRDLFVNNQLLRGALNNLLDQLALDHPLEIEREVYVAADQLLRGT